MNERERTDVLKVCAVTRARGPGGRVVWGVGLSSCDLQVAGSIPVATRSRDPPYHRGFGDCEVQLIWL